ALPCNDRWRATEQVDGEGGRRPGWKRPLQGAPPDKPAGRQAQDTFAGGIPHVRHGPKPRPVLLDAIRAARPRPVSQHYPRFTEVFRQIVLRALQDGGNLPPDAEGRLTDALRGY